tara:strand:+ start:333 stop:515 length:183 start_codon:yes stop_codon:yes gene_type:complete
MEIKDAQYIESTSDWGAKAKAIQATIDGVVCSIPISEGNRHYDEIQRQIKAGTLTIKDAD